MRPAATLPAPAGLRDVYDAHPRAFELGAEAAVLGADEASNPYSRAAERGAFAAGWISVKESWVSQITGGPE